MITGKTLVTKELMTIAGQMIKVRVVRPDFSSSNVQELLRVADDWERKAVNLMPRYGESDITVHAIFASNASFLAASGLSGKMCCILVAQDEQDKIIGVMLYRLEEKKQIWWIDVMTTSPENQPGYPSEEKIRGIGSTMLGAASQDMINQVCTEVQLFALDRDAERFWRNRGFHDTVEPLRMSCREVQALAKELASSHPDDPQRGDVPFAGERSRLRAVSKPALAVLFR